MNPRKWTRKSIIIIIIIISFKDSSLPSLTQSLIKTKRYSNSYSNSRNTNEFLRKITSIESIHCKGTRHEIVRVSQREPRKPFNLEIACRATKNTNDSCLTLVSCLFSSTSSLLHTRDMKVKIHSRKAADKKEHQDLPFSCRPTVKLCCSGLSDFSLPSFSLYLLIHLHLLLHLWWPWFVIIEYVCEI